MIYAEMFYLVNERESFRRFVVFDMSNSLFTIKTQQRFNFHSKGFEAYILAMSSLVRSCQVISDHATILMII